MYFFGKILGKHMKKRNAAALTKIDASPCWLPTLPQGLWISGSIQTVYVKFLLYFIVEDIYLALLKKQQQNSYLIVEFSPL